MTVRLSIKIPKNTINKVNRFLSVCHMSHVQCTVYTVNCTLYGAVYTTVPSAVYTTVPSEVYTTVPSAVYTTVPSEV